MINLYKFFCACALIILIMLLSGCSTYNAVVAEKGAQASDDATDAALWALCNAMPVGAIKRQFKTDAERAAYNEICPNGELP